MPIAPGTRYCAACGSTLLTLRLGHHWRCEACGITDWKNPLPVAGTFIVREDRVLLVRRSEAMERGAGGWVFPGGFVERGETPWQAAVRETEEEALVTPVVRSALPPRTVITPHHVVMPFLAEIAAEDEPRPGLECSEVRWFAFDEIPWEEISFSTTVDALRGIVDGDEGIEVFRPVPGPGRSRSPFRFCVGCGTPLHPPGEDGAVRCPACGWTRWDNPSPVAGFLAVRDRRVLLGLRRAGFHGGSRWSCPAGYMEPGETPGQTAERELREESGITARAERFVGLFASGDHHEAIYTGELLDIDGTPSNEFEQLRWFTGAEAAALNLHYGAPDLVQWARRTGLLD